MNSFLERLAVENSNKCNELGTEIEDLKRKMFDLQNDYNNVVSKHNELADRINKALEIVDNINKQYEKISDKDLLTNNVVHISVIQEIENTLKGEE